MPVPDNLAIDR